ncbi:MAG: hypothetical protein PF508_06535, partial [Spirochaeta sp.]|nr:hypothetical protein [Spirochaeta sp.]
MKTKKVLQIFTLFVVVLFLASLGACTSVDQLTQRGMGIIGGGNDEGGSTSSRSDDGDAEDSPMGGVDPTLMMLPPAAAFQIVYAQTTLFTMASVSVSDFAVGEGIRWALTWHDDEGASDTLFTEQALLTRGDAGEWWYISLSDGEYTIEYEYLIDGENVVTELLYRDSDRPQTRSATVNVPLDRMEEDEEFDSFY